MEKKIYKNHEPCKGCNKLGFKTVKMCYYLGSYCTEGYTPRKNGYCKMKEVELKEIL